MNRVPHNKESRPLTILCLASYEKGQRFISEARQLGCRVYLLTSLSLRDKADFPREDLEDIFYLPDKDHEWDLDDLVKAVSHLCRTVEIDRIVPLDDFDLEKAALLREHLRMSGMGETQTRYFRDKLAMRMRAAENGIPVPDFTACINYQEITRFVDSVPPPWVLKPRLMAGALGIRKVRERQEAWDRIHELGDEQSTYLLERFIPGDIFHVDSIWFRGEVVFSVGSAYGTPPLEVSKSGGVFTTRLVERHSEIDRQLRSCNERLLKVFGLENGVSHTEFIRAHHNGGVYFLETSARVGGAYIADLIEAATGVNLWREWARIERATFLNEPYRAPEFKHDYAGLLVSLARQEWPQTEHFNDPEVVLRIKKQYHVGFIVKSADYGRVTDLLQTYTERVRDEFQATLPHWEKKRE